jgi:uncharacterized repeat protein (TIGR02543 family)
MRRRITATAAATTAAAALITGIAFAKAPSIALHAPGSAPAGSSFAITVSGYFNCTKKNIDHKGACANFALVDRFQGTRTCSRNMFGHGGTFVAGGPADKKFRAKAPTRPGSFSTTANVTAPNTAGNYTLCGFLNGYPVAGFSTHVATAHLSVSPAVRYTLSVSVAGGGAGQVAGYTDADNGDSIFCDPFEGINTCSHAYPPGAVVHLNATALGGIWVGWSGACSGTDFACDVTMDGDKTATATFTPSP